jgi:isopentenyl-diphosphate delta-isomerase
VTTKEKIVLVNEKNEPIGTAPKLATHSKNTPLHRGFSVFLFNSLGELLLQQRARSKKTWPLVWSNSACGHPMQDEASIEAAKRRLKFEIGILEAKIYEVLPDYRYKAEYRGVVENEFCPVFVAFSDQKPQPNKDEVENIRWVPWRKFLTQIKDNPDGYSIWSVEEAELLSKNPKFNNLWEKHSASK